MSYSEEHDSHPIIECAWCGEEIAVFHDPAVYEGSNAGTPGTYELNSLAVTDKNGNEFCSPVCCDEYHDVNDTGWEESDEAK